VTGPKAPSVKIANLAFVAPISPNKTCLVEIDILRSRRLPCEESELVRMLVIGEGADLERG
jgi:hypothetical protein